MTVLDTPEKIEVGRLLMIRSGLKLETTTGLRMTRGNMCFNAAKAVTGKKTRAACLAEINKRLAVHGL